MQTAHGPESTLALLLQVVQVLQLGDLGLAGVAQPAHLATQLLPLLLKAVLELLDLANQQPVVKRHQVEIAVAVDEVGEALGGEQDLDLG